MMTGLLRNSVPQAGTAQEKMKALGMNSGNLVFWHALKRLFAPVDIAYTEKEKLSLCDKVIVTDLIWIRENANFEYLEKLVDSYAIPFIPISIGLQNDRFDPDFALNSGTCRLLKKMQERALLGVRGEYTADILSKHGIRNISVIGCPSMYYWGNPDLNISAQGKAERVSSNFRTFYGPLTVPEKHFLSYCADRDMQFIEQTEWAFTEDQAKDRKFFEYIDSWLSKSKILPLDFDEWSAALKNMDFSIGGRFHGNVIALWKGIKSLFLTVDSRTKELTDFFRLPSLPMNKFNKNRPIEYYYELADYSKFNRYYPSIFKNFESFAKANRLHFCFESPLWFHGQAKDRQASAIKRIEIGDIHATEYRGQNAIVLKTIKKTKNKIAYEYETSGKFSDLFADKRPFEIEYECDIEQVPDSVAVLPFAALVLPVCWLSDAVLYLDDIDEDFLKSIDDFKRGFVHMYPKLDFWGGVVVKKITKNRVDHVFRKMMCFFSGGVDAVSTMLNNMDERPTLFTIWGTDVYFEQEKAWGIVKKKVQDIANEFGLPYTTVKSSFRYVLDEKLLTKIYAAKVNENWWHGFEHGIALLAHAAPYAFARNITDIKIAATYSVKDSHLMTCASYPSIDEMMRFCGCKIYHDGFEKSRMDKVRQIVGFAKANNMALPLRVCWEQITGENCCVCEKCCRTIFAIYAAGGEPEAFGFALNDEKTEIILNNIRHSTMFNNVYWDEIRKSLYEKRADIKNNPLVNALLENYVPDENRFVPTRIEVRADKN